MLYEELKNLTKGECTAEEYEAINAVYMSLEDMTKAQAAKLWHQLYAKKHAAEKKAAEEKSHSLAYLDEVTRNTVDGEKVELPNGDLVTVFWNASYTERRITRRVADNITDFMETQTIALSGYNGILAAAKGNPARLTA